MATPQQNITRNAKNMIEEEIGSENMNAVLGVLQPIGDYAVRAVRFTAGYTRRHPIRMAITVVALGFLGSLLAKSKIPQTLH